ncbi:DUF397 domain-containing protein [Streptomyces sp. NPDC016845]|uniref:DUF397 domain-containing protein n=1 Tax=Streptomyces sp. NPDC016845 TaxID=3364972 RepID=UPI003787627B
MRRRRAAAWFTSSYSDTGGQCTEVATNVAASRGPAGLFPSVAAGVRADAR